MPAAADAPRDQGWWTLTNPLPTPPDVPAGGMLVQAGLGSPASFAALVYEVEPGASAVTLTLTVAPNSATTPSSILQLCPLTGPIAHPEQGGPLADAPAYKCDLNVTAGPASNGKDYQFSVSGLVSDGLLAVALLPNGSSDRVVLSSPDTNSLSTQQTSVLGATPPPAATDTLGASGSVSGPPAEGVSPGVAAPPLGPGALPGVDTPGSPAVSPAPGTARTGPPDPRGAFVPAVSRGPEEATPVLVLLLVVGALAGAGLWLYAGRQREDLVPVGRSPG